MDLPPRETDGGCDALLFVSSLGAAFLARGLALVVVVLAASPPSALISLVVLIAAVAVDIMVQDMRMSIC